MADEPSADELVEELRRAKVSDLLVHTLSMVASMGFAKLAPEGRDLEQAKIAIEALKALLPVLEGDVEEDGAARLRPGAREPPARLRRRREGGRCDLTGACDTKLPAPRETRLDFVRGAER